MQNQPKNAGFGIVNPTTAESVRGARDQALPGEAPTTKIPKREGPWVGSRPAPTRC
jgi:hypothetical protein